MVEKYVQLKLEEREEIMALKWQGKSMRVIAKVIGRHHSTISRELRRNYRPKFYWACIANRVTETRKRKAAKRERLKSDVVRLYVHKKLILGWSPEQIAGKISMDEPAYSISHETIYQYIYCDAKELIPYLPRRHRRRRVKHFGRKPKVCLIPNRISIDKRPDIINQRQVFGHWETDLMVSRQSRTVLNVLVERRSRYVKLTKLPDKTAARNREAIVRRLCRWRKASRLSITYDNGTENRDHGQVNQTLKTTSYFCNPYHSWEKGTVENTNGLIRRFIPKKTDLAKIPTAHIKRIENFINNRPRKCLQYQTPKEVFETLSGALAS